MSLPIEDPVFGGVNYTASAYMMELLYALGDGRDPGTGIKPFSRWSKNLMGPKLPEALLNYNVGMQVNLLGGYPISKDIVPSAIFTAVFVIFTLTHLAIFVVNCGRNHYFYLSLYWVGYGILRSLGFGLRILWAHDITLVDMAIADECMLVLGNVALVASNLVLAQRLFSWRHPVGGARRLFRYTMYGMYLVVAGVIAMTVTASAVPYLYYLSSKVFWHYKICVMVSSILIILYSLTAISLLGLSYFFKPTRKDENLYTYQPWWIESFSPFYFVKKGAKLEAEETFMKRNHNHRHAVRVIAATHHHYNMVEGLTNQRGDLTHNTSILIIFISTTFLFLASVVRCIAVFQANAAFRGGRVCEPVLMYIVWGLLEVVINILFLVGRVDLRFYRPDKLPKKVRAIITAEQSVMVSANQSDLEYSDDEEFDIMTVEDKYSFQGNPRPPTYHLQLKHSDDSDTDKKTSSNEGHSYTQDDNASEFNF
ncbi:hypothetical protein CANTEDRAFT_127772 [Yamadazyma tenuis ATCC 10573]|uniref:Uncharacterized protein n=2 Tax=Candida tenuis TaxID=2315449 RepID=G3BE97_CANTC|nr:uncharacterized protein CANTEDRAFT_127772 [Yamadazyma tenuis ATCC 10573]EGV60495.1 hypothetical protein CANTEDRAFT_127772 [Yamadazyma tenuis ATCC 10573]